jgi:dTDP-4-dehydrorhamnose 3,5-epimerase
MKFIDTSIKGLYSIQFEPILDNRGKFYRIYCKNEFEKINHHKEIVQINQSFTIQKGSIRGMHFQYPPKTEIKMIRCTKGSVFDVAVDLRAASPTFLKWHGQILSESNLEMLYVPEGFAHGFQTLEDNTELLYFHTEFYAPQYEGGIRFNDPKVNINWPLEITNVSNKDLSYNLIDEDFKGILL